MRIIEKPSAIKPPEQSFEPSQPKFPPSGWSRDVRKIYYSIESIIKDNPKLAGEALLGKIKAEFAK